MIPATENILNPPLPSLFQTRSRGNVSPAQSFLQPHLIGEYGLGHCASVQVNIESKKSARSIEESYIELIVLKEFSRPNDRFERYLPRNVTKRQSSSRSVGWEYARQFGPTSKGARHVSTGNLDVFERQSSLSVRRSGEDRLKTYLPRNCTGRRCSSRSRDGECARQLIPSWRTAINQDIASSSWLSASEKAVFCDSAFRSEAYLPRNCTKRQHSSRGRY